MIIQGTTYSFDAELWQAIHNFGPATPDTFKIALYTANASLGPDTTIYVTDGEVVATGYTAGGQGLTISAPPACMDGVTYFSFAPVSWTAAITARGALVYNSTKANRAVFVLNFGGDKTSSTTFDVAFPAATSASAIIRSLRG